MRGGFSSAIRQMESRSFLSASWPHQTKTAPLSSPNGIRDEKNRKAPRWRPWSYVDGSGSQSTCQKSSRLFFPCASPTPFDRFLEKVETEEKHERMSSADNIAMLSDDLIAVPSMKISAVLDKAGSSVRNGQWRRESKSVSARDLVLLQKRDKHGRHKGAACLRASQREPAEWSVDAYTHMGNQISALDSHPKKKIKSTERSLTVLKLENEPHDAEQNLRNSWQAHRRKQNGSGRCTGRDLDSWSKEGEPMMMLFRRKEPISKQARSKRNTHYSQEQQRTDCFPQESHDQHGMSATQRKEAWEHACLLAHEYLNQKLLQQEGEPHLQGSRDSGESPDDALQEKTNDVQESSSTGKSGEIASLRKVRDNKRIASRLSAISYQPKQVCLDGVVNPTQAAVWFGDLLLADQDS